jgi:FK506-binding protein 1
MGVTKTTISEGSGASPNKGDRVTMEYTGWLKTAGKAEEKGKEFDSTKGRGSFETKIGVGQVIKGMFPLQLELLIEYWLTIAGWDEGVVQMKLGEKARLDITSDFAYGDQYVSFPGDDATEAC